MWVADRVHAEGPNYLRCDVGMYRQVERLFADRTYDLVYHLAAEFGRWNGEDFYETLWQSNAIGTKNLLRMQEKHGFRMVFTSSSEVYGDYEGEMVEDVLDRVPIRQLNDYAITKWVNEMQIMNSAERFGTETVRVRLFNTYGPGERFGTETVRVRLFNTYGPGEYYSEYRSVICRFIYHALHDLPYTVYLDHHRSSTYIDDTVRTLANISENFKPGEVYNIAGEEYHDIKTLSDMILSYLGKDDSLVEYVEFEKHNTRNKLANVEKAKRDLGHECTVSLAEGIPRTIEWQKEVYKRD